MSRITFVARTAEEWRHVDPMLEDITLTLLMNWPGKYMEVTSIFRSRYEDRRLGGSGVHSADPHRALDIRVYDLGNKYQQIADQLASSLNDTYMYDPERQHLKVAVAKLHGSGPHMHLQVHPRTVAKSVFLGVV
jgi:hypothetical protein